MRLELDTRRFYLGRDYSEALEAMGALPVHIALIPKPDYISRVLEGLDGVLLPGCDSDLDPALYGEQPHPKLGRVVPEKDQTDMLVLEEAEKRNLPVLAICFGVQALNVFRGGTLIQDIESQVPNCIKHEQGRPLERNSHSIDIEKGSILAGFAANRDIAMVNSHHHQAIKSVGRDLKATAWAKDGIIECIEDTREGKFVFGVQWHPELSWNSDDISSEIFRVFVDRCIAQQKNMAIA